MQGRNLVLLGSTPIARSVFFELDVLPTSQYCIPATDGEPKSNEMLLWLNAMHRHLNTIIFGMVALMNTGSSSGLVRQ